MLQQSSSASNCTRMRTRIVMEEKYTVCQHSKPFVLNGRPYSVFLVFRIKYTSDVIVVPCCVNSTISTFFISQKTVVTHQLSGRQMFVLFFSACLLCECVLPLLWMLFGFRIHKWNPVSSPVPRTMWSRNLSPSLWYCAKNSKPKPFSAFCEHCRNPSCGKLVIV
jgi:hypothetical protein